MAQDEICLKIKEKIHIFIGILPHYRNKTKTEQVYFKPYSVKYILKFQ